MVAIVTNNGLGLSGSSRDVLGETGQIGAGGLGQAGSQVQVNGQTGNLIVQQPDEILAGRGIDVSVVRTYNSRATFDFDNNDGWQISLYRKLSGLTGTVNSAGSSIVLTEGDGSQHTYSYDDALGKYKCTDGAGSYDTLSYNGSTWIWTDGNSRSTATFSASEITDEWRITSQADADGNTTTYTYDSNGLISQIETANGETVTLTYNVGKQLQSVQTTADGISSTRVYYSYDSQGRLSQVQTDLTPEDGSIADGKVYSTSYTYDGTSTRIASIENNDGTKVSITYDASDRVQTLTDAAGKVTTITYVSSTQTTITDPLGQTSTLTYDAVGNLTQLQMPGGVNNTTTTISYTYDANGNVTQVIDSRNKTSTYQYDSNGNLTREQDAAGNVKEYAHDAANQLLSQTTYSVADPDGVGEQQASGAQTSYYAYDSESHLRFSISAEGRVTEYRYNAYGQQTTQIGYAAGTYAGTSFTETDLTTWAAAQDQSKLERTDTTYDARGLINKVSRYTATDASGAGINNGRQGHTKYVYDAAGRLLQKIDPRGVATTTSTAELNAAQDYLTAYAYDGLGRVISVTQYDSLGSAINTGGTTQTLTTYTDSNRTTEMTLANGLVQVSQYDVRGLLISQSQKSEGITLATTTYQYDAAGRLRITTDATGQKNYLIYDGAGRMVSSIDSTGSLVETRYNNAGQVIRTTQYATTVSADLTNLFTVTDGIVANVTLEQVRPAASTSDRLTHHLYDAAGRLTKSIDPAGLLTEYKYDGKSQLIETIAYAKLLSNARLEGFKTLTREISLANNDVQPILDATNDRHLRYFYSADGLLLGTLDGQGHLTEYSYNAAGERTKSTRYATVTDNTLWTSGTLDQLKQAVTATANLADQTSYVIYDGKGQVAGTVDAEGYLTENQYDRVGNLLSSKRYATQVTYDAAKTVSQLRPTSNSEDQSTIYVYDANNRIIQSTRSPDGTITLYTYDNVGNLTQTTVAANTADARLNQRRYDAQGRLTAEMSGIGCVVLAALTQEDNPPTQEQIDAVWNQYGTRHTYDAAGRRIATTTPDGTSTTGNKSLFYYDADGHLTHSINAVGEVTEYQYDNFGAVIAIKGYANRIDAGTLATLTGGLASNLTAIIANLMSSADRITQTRYDRRGLVTGTTDALGNIRSFTYNAFGQEASRTDNGLTVTRTYDRRGLLTKTVEDSTGINRITQAIYDAFGRMTQSIDALGKNVTYAYDRLGRQITVTDPNNATRSQTYDAFSRVLTQTDALGNTTTYTYDLSNRSMTLTTAEGVSVTTLTNRLGQTVEVVDGKGQTTSYAYDENGNLISATDAQGNSTSNVYDAANRLIETLDANGVATTLSYDAANRLLTRTQDPLELNPSGLNLSTQYRYDAFGEMVWSCDANGVWTQTQYDAKGQVTTVTVDPTQDPDGNTKAGALNLQTSYTYDADGRTLTVTTGASSTTPHTTQYVYDKLGRRTQEITDPSGLALTTTYTYDKNDNVIARTDANGNVTRFAYDANNRLTYTVDALGGVTQTIYDAKGQVIQVTTYATAIDLTGLDAALNAATSGEAEIAARLTINANDQTSRYVYDQDGRLTVSIDALGYVTRQEYDPNGNVTKTIRYANPLQGTFIPGEPLQILTDAPAEAVTYSYIITSTNDQIIQTEYDATNRATDITNPLGTVTHIVYDANGHVTDKTEAYGIGAAVTTHYAYDAAGRLTDEINAYGTSLALTRHLIYNPLGQVTDETQAWGTDQATTTHYVYNAAGRAIAKTVAYGKAEAATTLTEYDAFGNAVKVTDPNGNAEYFWFDANNQSILHVDAEGYATATSYNAKGEITQITRYVATLTDPFTVSTLPTLVATSGKDQITTFEYDNLGHQTKMIDAEGFSESTTYDAFGNKKSFINKKGAKWTYDYDAAGHMEAEHTPLVTVTSVGSNLSSTQQLVSIENRFEYDAFGKLVAQIEAYGRPESRTTRYVYDALGNQIKTIYPQVSVYDAAADNLSTNGVNGQVVRTEKTATPMAEVTFNSLGQAVVNKDVAGVYSYKVYNALGQVQYEIDAEHYLTEHRYDSAGNETQLIRFAKALTFGFDRSSAFTAGEVSTLIQADAQNDRVLTKTYDSLNRLTRLVEPAVFNYDSDAPVGSQYFTAGRVTTNEYSATGQLIRQRVLKNPQTDTWTETYYYYDARGNKTAQVDALGYLTTWQYDETGDVVCQTEYAQALTGGTWNVQAYAAPTATIPQTSTNSLIGYDRITTFQYDRKNQKVAETRVNTEYSTVSGVNTVTTQFGDVTTRFGYDAVGNLVSTTDAAGASTYIYYDALGHKTAVAAPTRASDVASQSTSLTPLSEFHLDVFGNTVEQVDYSKGAASANASSYSVAGTDTTNDKVSFYFFDSHGHVVRSVEAEGASTYTSNDVAGNVVKQWQPIVDADGRTQNAIQLFQYDRLGQQTATIDPGYLTDRPAVSNAPFVTLAENSVNASVSESARYYQVDVSVGDHAPKYETRWNPTNTVALTWGSMEGWGDGDVEVTIDYNYKEYTLDTGATNSITRTFSAVEALAGVNVIWEEEQSQSAYGVTDIGSIQVRKKDVNGEWVIIRNQGLLPPYINKCGTSGSTPLNILTKYRFAVSADATVKNVMMRYRLVGDTTWQDREFESFGGAQFTTVGGNGTYEYELYYTGMNDASPTVMSSGNFTVGESGCSVKSNSDLVHLELDPSTFNRQEARYNAFGEITVKGINGGWQEYYDYDQAGHLWRTNDKDGVAKVYLNDLQGHTTAEIKSQQLNLADAVYNNPDDVASLTSNVQRTNMRYDALGHTVQQFAPTIYIENSVGGAPVSVETIRNLSYDRWGNVLRSTDPRNSNWVTVNRYDSLNNLVEQRLPVVDIGNADGTVTQGRPTSRSYYDMMGRAIGTADANGNTNSARFDAAGQIIAEYHADYGVVKTQYDAFGRKIRTVDAVGNATLYTYDRNDRLVEEKFATGVNTYEYDAAGNRILETNANGETTTYWYDTRGKLTRSRLPLGQSTYYAYDSQGNKIQEVNANGDTKIWSYDHFGRLNAHVDLGRIKYSYTYNNSGQMLTQTNDRGVSITNSYYENGMLKSIVDNKLDSQTYYEYDAAGNRTRESLFKQGINIQDVHTQYDSLGRMTQVEDKLYTLIYSYDAVGNRRRALSSYYDENNVLRSEDNWYTYDSMNRMTMSQGTLANGVIQSGSVASASSTETPQYYLTYDNDGIVYTGPDGQWGYADARSDNGATGSAYVSATVGQTNLAGMFGLNSDPLSDKNFTSLDYAWYTSADGIARIYENGTEVGAFGAYATSDDFSIAYDGTTVRYMINGVVKYTAETEAGRTFYFDSSFRDSGYRMGNIAFGASAAQAVSVNGVIQMGAVSRITSEGASQYYLTFEGDSIVYGGPDKEWGHADARSDNGVTGSAYVSAHAGQIDKRGAFGLNADPLSDKNYTSLDYAWCTNFNETDFHEADADGKGAYGIARIFENGQEILLLSEVRYTSSDEFAIDYDGTTVRYLLNGKVVRAVETEAGRTFYFDSSFLHTGYRLGNVRFGLSEAQASTVNGVTQSGGLPSITPVVSTDSYLSYEGRSVVYSGPNGAWGYADMRSDNSQTGMAYVSATAGQTNLSGMIGLNSDPLTNKSYASIDYAWYAHYNGNLYIYENGSQIGSFGLYKTSDVLAIEYGGAEVRYLLNGVVKRTVATTADRTFYLDSSFYNTGFRFNDVMFGTNVVDAEQAALSIGPEVSINGNSVTYNGTTGWGEADVHSQESYTGGAVVSATVGQTNLGGMFGLNSDPLTNKSYASIDYAWYAHSNGYLYIYENGSQIGSFGQYLTSDVLAVEYVGTEIRYSINGVIKRTVSTTANRTFYFDSAFNDTGFQLNDIRFGPKWNQSVQLAYGALADMRQTTITPLVSSQCYLSYEGNSVVYDGPDTAWGHADARSKNGVTGEAYVSATSGQTNLSGMFGLNSDPLTNKSYASIDFAWYAHYNGNLYIYENGVSRGSFGPYTTNDVLSIEYVGTEVRYAVNGVVKYTTNTTAGQTLYFDSSFYNIGCRLNNIMFAANKTEALQKPIVFGSDIEVEERTITYNGIDAAWGYADAHSSNSLTGSAYVSASAGQTNLSGMIGLNADPFTDKAYASLDYAFYAHYNGNLYIYENGSSIAGLGKYTTNDKFAIEYAGTQVRYWLNGVLKRTVNTTAGRTFYMDSSYYNKGFQFTNVKFGANKEQEEQENIDLLTPLTIGQEVTIDNNNATYNGAAAWGEADVRSNVGYTGGAIASARVGQTNKLGAFGLNTDPLSDRNYTSLDYAWYVDAAGIAYIYESGTNRGDFGTYTTSDVFAIEYIGKEVRYAINGVIKRTVTTDENRTFYFDSAFNDTGFKFNDIHFGSNVNQSVQLAYGTVGGQPQTGLTPAVSSITPVASSEKYLSYEGNSVVYNGPNGDWGYADVRSKNGIAGGAYASATAGQTNLSGMFGLNSDPLANKSYASLDYAWYVASDGVAYIRMNGSNIAGLDTYKYSKNDVFAIEYVGTEVHYLLNGEIKHTVNAATGLTFYFDSSFYHSGYRLNNIKFGANLKEALEQPIVFGSDIEIEGRTITYNGLNGTWGYSADAHSDNGMTGSGYVSASAGQTNKSGMIGLNSDPLTDKSYASLDYAWYAHYNGNLYIYENGASIACLGTYTTDNVFSIKYEGTTVTYLLNDNAVRTVQTTAGRTFYMDSSYYNTAFQFTNVKFGANAADAEQAGLSFGPEITVNGNSVTYNGMTGWGQADVRSEISYTGGAIVSATFGQTDKGGMFGLNADPLRDKSYASLDFAWYAHSNGNLYIYESGANRGTFGEYKTSDVLAIEYVGKEIRYTVNGVVKRTVTTTADRTFYFDTSFDDTGFQLNDIHFGSNANQSVRIAYDAAGNRRQVVQFEDGEVIAESYTYDANNRLLNTYRGSVIALSRAYDAAGRLVEQDTYTTTGTLNERRISTYDDNGRLSFQEVSNGSGTRTQLITYTAYLDTGEVSSYKVSSYVGTKYTNTFNYTYDKYDGYKEQKVVGKSTYFKSGNTTTEYDVNGNIVSVDDQFNISKQRYFETNQSGLILKKSENGKTQNYYYANDKAVGSSGGLTGADFDCNYAAISASYPASTPSSYSVNEGDTLRSIALTVFGDSQLWYLIADANGLSDDSELVEGTSLVIPNRVTNLRNASDTFKPYSPGQIIGDTTPTMPNPPPKGGGGCGGIAMIIIIVVAIVATVLTAGALAAPAGAALSTMWAAGVSALGAGLGGGLGLAGFALAGAVGSAASQLAGMAMGVQDKFSWKQVGMSAITSMVGAGASAVAGGIVGPAGGVPGAIGRAVVANVITQGVSVAVGQQEKFNWGAVAASGITAAAGEYSKNFGYVDKALVRGTAGGISNVLTGKKFATGFASGAVNAVSEKLTSKIGVDNANPELRGGFSHGLSHFFVQGTTEAILARIDGANGNTTARAFAAGGLAGFSAAVLTNELKDLGGGTTDGRRYLGEQMGRIIGVAVGNEAAGRSGALREINFNANRTEHLYMVGLAALKAGVPAEEVRKSYMYYSQLLDEIPKYDAVNQGTMVLKTLDGSQVELTDIIHNFKGRTVEESRGYWLDFMKENSGDKALQLMALHALVDVPYHAQPEEGEKIKDWKSYPSWIGHALSGSLPDNVGPSAVSKAKFDYTTDLLIDGLKIIREDDFKPEYADAIRESRNQIYAKAKKDTDSVYRKDDFISAIPVVGFLYDKYQEYASASYMNEKVAGLAIDKLSDAGVLNKQLQFGPDRNMYFMGSPDPVEDQKINVGRIAEYGGAAVNRNPNDVYKDVGRFASAVKSYDQRYSARVNQPTMYTPSFSFGGVRPVMP